MEEYEITYLLENEAHYGKKIVENAIENLEGKVNSVKPWGQRNLAYPIRKLNTAFYATVVFELEKAKIKKLNRQLLLEPELIRFLIVNDVIAKEIEDAPAPLAEEVPDTKKEIVKATSVEAVRKTLVSTSKEKIDESVKKTAKKALTPPKKKPAAKKKESVSDTERLKQLENKLQDLLKE